MAAVAITRTDLSAAELRTSAARMKDARAVRRTLAIALVLDGTSRAAAAAASGMVGAFGLTGTGCFVNAVDPFHVPRIMMVVSDDLDTFAAKVGWW